MMSIKINDATSLNHLLKAEDIQVSMDNIHREISKLNELGIKTQLLVICDPNSNSISTIPRRVLYGSDMVMKLHDDNSIEILKSRMMSDLLKRYAPMEKDKECAMMDSSRSKSNSFLKMWLLANSMNGEN